MSARPIALALCALMLAALGGCAGAHGSKVAICDGRHRRLVNINGSILGDVPAAAGRPAKPSPSPAGSSVGKAPAPKPAAVSAADGPAWFASC